MGGRNLLRQRGSSLSHSAIGDLKGDMNAREFDDQIARTRSNLSVPVRDTDLDLRRLIGALSSLKRRYVAKRWDALFDLVNQLPDRRSSR
jgi:hypothetical protein